jgi:WD40 repeat protein
MKCLEKERDRRYETANGFAADILRHLAGEAVQAVPPSALYRLRKSARKNRAILTTAAAFVALLLIAAAVSTWLAVQAKQAEAAAQMQQSAAETAEALTATERDHAQREWLRAEDAARQANASAAQAAQALDRLSAARGVQLADECDLFTGLLWLARPLERGGLTAAEERSYRTRFACYLRHTFGRPVLRDLFFHEGEVYLLRFSADGRRFLTGCGDNVRVWDLQSGDCLATLPIHSGEGTAQFSPDGTRVLVVDGRGLWSWDVRTARLADFSLLNPAALAEIIPGSTPESLWQALALTAAREWFKRDLESPLGTLSPDGRQALLALGPRVQLFDLPTRRLLQSWPKPPGYRQGLFTADGSRILLNADALRIYNAHPESGAKGDVDLSSAGSFESSNADGCRIVTLKSAEGNKEGLMAVRETSSGKLLCPISVSEEMGADHPADLSPDGQVLARHAGDIFHPGRLELWDVDHGRMLAQRPMRQNGISGVYFRSDGRQVATIGDRSVGLWNVPCWSHRRQA